MGGKPFDPLFQSSDFVVEILDLTRSRHADAQQQQLIMRVLQALPDTPVGRQIMMLFQCDRLIVRPSEFLQPSLAILARAEQRKKVGT